AACISLMPLRVPWWEAAKAYHTADGGSTWASQRHPNTNSGLLWTVRMQSRSTPRLHRLSSPVLGPRLQSARTRTATQTADDLQHPANLENRSRVCCLVAKTGRKLRKSGPTENG